MTDPLDRSTLRQKAEKATPGPWAYESTNEKGNDWCLGVVVDADNQPMSGRLESLEGDVDEEVCRGDGLHNAAYIAAASPDVLLTLLDHEAALREQLDAMRTLALEATNGWAAERLASKMLRETLPEEVYFKTHQEYLPGQKFLFTHNGRGVWMQVTDVTTKIVVEYCVTAKRTTKPR